MSNVLRIAHMMIQKQEDLKITKVRIFKINSLCVLKSCKEINNESIFGI